MHCESRTSKQIRIDDSHRPHRSSVILSRHDLQNVCWHGNCNGSRKISRHIGLKQGHPLKKGWHAFKFFFFYQVISCSMDLELRLDSVVLELELLSITSEMSYNAKTMKTVSPWTSDDPTNRGESHDRWDAWLIVTKLFIVNIEEFFAFSIQI